MNLHTFSKEAEPEMMTFLSAVKKNSVNAIKPPPALLALWEKYLPMDKNIAQIMDSIQCNTSDEIVDLTDSEKIIENTAEHAMAMKFEFEPSFIEATSGTNLNFTAVTDLTDAIIETLESGVNLPENLIIKLKVECTHNQLKQIFNSIAENLDSQLLYYLGHSICVAECAERNTVSSAFVEHILLEKLSHEHNDHLEKLLVKFLSTFPSETNLLLLKKIFKSGDKDLGTLNNHLNLVTSEQKQKLLSSFISDCVRLESHHLSTIGSILTTQVDKSSLEKMIDMLAQVVDDFLTDKTYGKLLLDVITLAGKNITNMESQIRYILSKHKSVWKNQIQSALESNIEQNQMSQSFQL